MSRFRRRRSNPGEEGDGRKARTYKSLRHLRGDPAAPAQHARHTKENALALCITASERCPGPGLAGIGPQGPRRKAERRRLLTIDVLATPVPEGSSDRSREKQALVRVRRSPSVLIGAFCQPRRGILHGPSARRLTSRTRAPRERTISTDHSHAALAGRPVQLADISVIRRRSARPSPSPLSSRSRTQPQRPPRWGGSQENQRLP